MQIGQPRSKHGTRVSRLRKTLKTCLQFFFLHWNRRRQKLLFIVCSEHCQTIFKSNNFFAAIHNWPGNVNHGLALDVGDFVEIFEESGAWWRGVCSRKPRAIGIFPKNYIHIKDVLKEDPVVSECAQVLREWSEIWKKLFVVGWISERESQADLEWETISD